MIPGHAAPLWRRLAAAVYDGLLLLGLWMVALLLDVVIRDQLLGIERDWAALRAYLFLVGLGFFGWFWTHGGQTLGMRAWKLEAVRVNGAPLRWTDAALRYALMMLSWGVCLTPALARLPQVASHPHAGQAALLSAGAVALFLALMQIDPLRRAPQDFFSRTLTRQRDGGSAD